MTRAAHRRGGMSLCLGASSLSPGRRLPVFGLLVWMVAGLCSGLTVNAVTAAEPDSATSDSGNGPEVNAAFGSAGQTEGSAPQRSPATVALVSELAVETLGDAKPISFRTQRLTERFFSEGAAVGDLNRDGHTDIVSGPFWWAGPTFEQSHPFTEPKPFDPLGYADNFFSFTHDFDSDGWLDVLVIGFPGQAAVWYQNPQGKAGMWVRSQVMEIVDNESPTWTDLTGDGRPEIVCSVNGAFGYATPNWNHPEIPWTFHAISKDGAGGRFTHGLGVGDVNGDGRADLLEKNGWWEQPASLDGDPLWTHHPVAFSAAGGAQMYAVDVDGDQRNDVITSLEAHGFGLVWYRQTVGDDNQPRFEPQTILGRTPSENPFGVCFSQIHAIDLVDMNGDQLPDLITGKRYWAHGPKGDPEPDAPAVVYWFELQRNADGSVAWIPHLVDNNSGVGVEVLAADVSGDGRPDIVVGNKQGVFVHTQMALESR
jgi:hypothetical protein